MRSEPINHIYIRGWFNDHAEGNARDIVRFISLAEPGVFELEYEMPGLNVYQYTGKNAGTNVHWFKIDPFGVGQVIAKVV